MSLADTLVLLIYRFCRLLIGVEWLKGKFTEGTKGRLVQKFKNLGKCDAHTSVKTMHVIVNRCSKCVA